MDDRSRPDLRKIRRFALAVSLVLITYGLALEFDSTQGVQPLGLPFKVVKPELLPIGLMLASLYGAVRFWYFGCLLTDSPSRMRTGLQRRADGLVNDERGPGIPTPEFQAEFKKSFPQILRGRRARIHYGVERGQVTHLAVEIPWEVRVATVGEQIDYTAPIWLNIVALGIVLPQLLRF